MNIVTTINEWLTLRSRITNQSVGFVATMGNLHLGHLSLINRSCIENEITIVSIFINPTQFNNKSDFENYTRTIERDCQVLSEIPVNTVLIPDPESMYPDNFQVQVHETSLSQEFEGAYRPGHFSGMLTIVMKLFHLINPTRSYFGEKDYQQLLLVQKMVSAMLMPIVIVPCITIRDPDGLALSSRNSRLSPKHRALASHFPKFLHSLNDNQIITGRLQSVGFTVEYVVNHWQRKLAAVQIGGVRLIDNIALTD